MPARVTASSVPSSAMWVVATLSCDCARAADGANAEESTTTAPPLVGTHGTAASSARHCSCSADLKEEPA
eukprot:5210612-Prymnesium_polylepis.1